MLHDTPALNKKNLFELLKDGSQELYEGSKYSKLEFLLKLYHIKCLSGLSDKGMTMILDLLRDAFKFAKIPDSFYEAKKTTNKLSLDYINIDVCPNDCMLYWEDDVNAETCLASDGFNPFETMNTSHSIWPVILVPYNLPLWLCMKQPNFIFSMTILGPRAPGNNIDVYLQPLIKELKELWSDGVDTFDSSKNEMFRMRAALMWIVSDFSRLDSLFGWNTHNSLACPSYNFDTEPCRLPHNRKWCFIDHRRFLSRNHKFKMMRHRFDEIVEERTPPKKLSGSDNFQQVKDINSRLNRPKHVNDEPNHNEASGKSSMFPQQGKPVGGSTTKPLTALEKTQAHRYVLLNWAAVKPFIDVDRCARQADLPYYGKLEDIIELNYYGMFKIILFKCLLADTTRNRGYKIDAWKFNCVNFSKLIHTGDREDHDPYIEASQANMVYYVDDETDKEYSVAVHLKPRDLFEMGEPKFSFKTAESNARQHIYKSIGKKWAANKNNLWKLVEDPLKSKFDIIDNVPDGIPRDQ
ncbi:hypothetical protein RDI58_020255 [Solanum bulbocastanum]|uniref:DUF4216 domain-containing protein n=1 Tax=Solanum bulbocastanum TaxID=147425 RepID=A0AAN8T6U3_SOLBU